MHLSRARTTPRARSRFAAVLTAVALIASACSGADDPEADQTGGAAASGEPQAIISLSPTTTEMLYAVGAGDRVVAVDERSNYPADAPVTDLSGYTPNLEAILGYQPDLVVATDDTGDIVSGLERSGSRSCCSPPHGPWTTPTPRSNRSARPPARSARPPSWSRGCGARSTRSWPRSPGVRPR